MQEGEDRKVDGDGKVDHAPGFHSTHDQGVGLEPLLARRLVEPCAAELVLPRAQARAGGCQEKLAGEAARDRDQHGDDGEPGEERMHVDARVYEDEQRPGPGECFVREQESPRRAALEPPAFAERVRERRDNQDRSDGTEPEPNPGEAEHMQRSIEGNGRSDEGSPERDEEESPGGDDAQRHATVDQQDEDQVESLRMITAARCLRGRGRDDDDENSHGWEPEFFPVPTIANTVGRMTSHGVRDPHSVARLRAGVISVVVGTALLGMKYSAYLLTGSAAVLSDALESIVNVVAATFALGSLVFAGRPADRDHPYGHGKMEYFSAVFEGGLIAFAAVAIAWYAVEDLLRGPRVGAVGLGALLTFAAGAANAGLGWYLVSTGRRVQSLVLIADGQHVLSDFWTSLGVVGGLVLVHLTGISWLDPAVALVLAANLARTGFSLVRHAAGGLLDEEDTVLLARLVAAFDTQRAYGIIRIHRLRAIRAGRFAHVDAHVIVPEHWTVEQAHDATDAFERRVIADCAIEGEIVFHTDPCRRRICPACDLADCPIRQSPFVARPPLTIDEACLTDEAFWGPRGFPLRVLAPPAS